MIASSFAENLLDLYLDAAPWLLLGLIAAGLIKAWLPEGTINRWLGGRGLWPVTKAALVGAPLPLCSCGVLPAALELRRSGASRGSTVSFLIATPETGADSIAISYALLGPVMAVIRPIAAILSAIFAGVLTMVADPPERAGNIMAGTESTSGGGGCSGCCSASCGSGDTTTAPTADTDTFTGKTVRGIGYALSDILDDIALWLLVGLLLAALIATAVPPQALAEYGSGLPAMLLMLLAGIPMYICATASTPLAASLLLAGISPGTVLVFLLAGPATNIATLGVVGRELGRPALITYLIGIGGAAIALGLLTDALLGHYGIDVHAQLGEGGELLPAWLAWLTWGSAALLALAAIKPLRRKVVGV